MEIVEIKARVRNEFGKGPARRLRTEGFIPAVFYGPKSETISLAVNASELRKLVKDKEENIFIKLLVDDENKLEKLSMIKEIQTDPLTKRLVHADFYEIRMDQKITFDIPIHFEGVPVGLEKGGELHHNKRDLKVECLPGMLPDFIAVDVTHLNIGDSIHVQDIKIADDITILDSEDAVIAMVVASRITKETAGTEAAETAPAEEEKKAKAE